MYTVNSVRIRSGYCIYKLLQAISKQLESYLFASVTKGLCFIPVSPAKPICVQLSEQKSLFLLVHYQNNKFNWVCKDITTKTFPSEHTWKHFIKETFQLGNACRAPCWLEHFKML